MGWLWRGTRQSHLYWRSPQWQEPLPREWTTHILGLCHGFFTDWLTFRYILESVEHGIGNSSPSKCSYYKIEKCLEPSKSHANFVLDFSFLNFFLTFKFLSWFFFYTFIPPFSPSSFAADPINQTDHSCVGVLWHGQVWFLGLYM